MQLGIPWFDEFSSDSKSAGLPRLPPCGGLMLLVIAVGKSMLIGRELRPIVTKLEAI